MDSALSDLGTPQLRGRQIEWGVHTVTIIRRRWPNSRVSWDADAPGIGIYGAHDLHELMKRFDLAAEALTPCPSCRRLAGWCNCP